MKSTKTKLISSVTVLLICFAMLIGSTFAWFTDSASTGVNKIQAGNLDIEAYYQNTKPGGGNGTTSYTLPSNSPRGTQIYFEDAKHSLDGAVLIDDSVKFEPGYVGAKLVTVKNTGNLAAKIKLQFAVNDNDLASQIWYDFIQVSDTNSSGTFVARELTGIKDFVANREMPLSAGNEYKFIFMYGMKETAGNEYQGKSVGLSVTVLAKQLAAESDSFDNQYDINAQYDPTIWDGSIATSVEEKNGIYEINTATELAWVAQAVNSGANTFDGKTVKLMKDINLANIPWTPIGINNGDGSRFKGTFDGNDKSISNIYCTNPNYGGLFGYMKDSVTIKKLKLNNVNLTNGGNTDGECAGGALIGYIALNPDNSTVNINDITVTGIKVDGYKFAGGLVGYQTAEGSDNNKTLIIDNVSIVGTDTMKTINSSFYKDNDYKGHVGGLIGYYTTGAASNITLNKIDITRSGVADSDRAGVLVGTLLANANITSATVSYVTLLGTSVTSTSNMKGPDASHGTVGEITVR